MQDSQRIQGISRFMQHLCTFLIWVLPLSVVLMWFVFDDFLFGVVRETVSVKVDSFSFMTRLLGCLVNLIPVGLLAYGLSKLRRLFSLYQARQIFGQENTQALLSFARMLFAYAITKPITSAITSVIVTFNNPPGERQLAISLSSNDLGVFFISGVFFIIAWVMAEAHKLAQDNAQIV